MENMKSELKPCPFCGSDRVYILNLYHQDTVYGMEVRCGDCGAKITEAGKENRARLIERWNRRV